VDLAVGPSEISGNTTSRVLMKIDGIIYIYLYLCPRPPTSRSAKLD